MASKLPEHGMDLALIWYALELRAVLKDPMSVVGEVFKAHPAERARLRCTFERWTDRTGMPVLRCAAAAKATWGDGSRREVSRLEDFPDTHVPEEFEDAKPALLDDLVRRIGFKKRDFANAGKAVIDFRTQWNGRNAKLAVTLDGLTHSCRAGDPHWGSVVEAFRRVIDETDDLERKLREAIEECRRQDPTE